MFIINIDCKKASKDYVQEEEARFYPTLINNWDNQICKIIKYSQ